MRCSADSEAGVVEGGGATCESGSAYGAVEAAVRGGVDRQGPKLKVSCRLKRLRRSWKDSTSTGWYSAAVAGSSATGGCTP